MSTERLSEATFVTSHTFDAARELVWAALTEPERMREWYGSKEATALRSEMDFRPGGAYHYGTRMPDGSESWGKAVYREIEAPGRLRWVNSFSNPEGGLERHPLAADWPLEMLTTYTLTEEGGKTTLRVEWRAINAAENEEKVFADNFENCRRGWGASFAGLESYLAKAQQ